MIDLTAYGTASDISDWADAKMKVMEESFRTGLYGYLLDNRYADNAVLQFGVAAADTGFDVVLLVGGAVVDVLRLGSGAGHATGSGDNWGWLQDGLRLFSVAGPVARFPFLFRASPRTVEFLSVAADGQCTWVSAANAMRAVGAKAYCTLEHLAKAVGRRSAAELTAATIADVRPAIVRLGARFYYYTRPVTIGAAEKQILAANRGAWLISMEWKNALGPQLHTVMAEMRNGVVHYVDPCGAQAKTLQALENMIVDNAGPMGAKFDRMAGAVPTAIAQIRNGRILELWDAVSGATIRANFQTGRVNLFRSLMLEVGYVDIPAPPFPRPSPGPSPRP